MNTQSSSQDDDLLASWLASPPEAQTEWLAHNRSVLTLAFLEGLKGESDQRLRTEPQCADQITQAMLQIAHQMADEPLAYPLACWARGNWLAYHRPQEAIIYYNEALAGYQPTGNTTAVLTLLNNLLIANTESNLPQAWALYQHIERLRPQLTDEHYILLLRIEQNSGILLRRLGHYPEALAAHLRARAIAIAHQQLDRIAEINGNLAITYGSLGQFKQCEELLLQARTGAKQINHHLTAARMEMNLGRLYTILGRPAEALQRFQVAREEFTRLGNTMEIGSIALREAHLLERIGAVAQAIRSYTRAQTHFQSLQMWPQVWQATLEGAITQRVYGEYQQAAALLDRAAALWQSQQQAAWRSEWTLEKAALALAQEDSTSARALLVRWQDETPSHLQTPGQQARRQGLWAELTEQQWRQSASVGDWKDAQSAYQAVLTYAEAEGELRMARQALVGLGHLERPVAPSDAKQRLLDAAQHDDLIRLSLSVQELKAAFLNQSSDALETLFTWAYEDQEAVTALLLSWRAKGSALWELLTANQPKQNAEAAGGAIDEIRDRLAAVQWQLAFEMQQKQPEAKNIATHRAEAARLEQQLLERRRQQNQQVALSDRLHLSNLSDQSLSTIVAGMEAQLLIEYMQAQGQIYAIVVDKVSNCRVHQLTDVDTALDLIDSLTMTFRALLAPPYQPQKQANFLAECRQCLARGYDLLLRPLQLPADAAKLLIAPCTPLHQLPFAALWDGEHYLVEEQTIELTPTGILLAAPRPVATVSQPLAIASSVNGALPINLQQAESLRQAFPTATLLLDDPNSLGYLQNLTVAPRFVHLTAHTQAREDAPIFTALQLAGSTLTVEQCYDLPLYGSELITLSSCTTNAGMDSSGSLLAFQSAFFMAGAQRVLSTLWEIHEETTVEWMAIFYQQVAAGLPPVEALRQTQLRFLANPRFCHPAYWAAFVCSRR